MAGFTDEDSCKNSVNVVIILAVIISWLLAPVVLVLFMMVSGSAVADVLSVIGYYLLVNAIILFGIIERDRKIAAKRGHGGRMARSGGIIRDFLG